MGIVTFQHIVCDGSLEGKRCPKTLKALERDTLPILPEHWYTVSGVDGILHFCSRVCLVSLFQFDQEEGDAQPNAYGYPDVADLFNLASRCGHVRLETDGELVKVIACTPQGKRIGYTVVPRAELEETLRALGGPDRS